MKNITYAFALMVIVFMSAFTQKGKYSTSTGKVSFFSTTPIENIDATNNKVTSFLDTDNGGIVFSMNIKDFVFDKSLMQEHFNENYMESDKYPKSTFKGKITNLSEVDFSKDGSYATTIEGELTIHNVTKPVKATGKIEVKAGKIIATSKFQVKLKDYGIEIPTVVFQKIAEVVDVNVDITYSPYTK